MGIIRAGILSRVSGKVAGVVGGSWKDKAYLREYVIPANPNTTPQQLQRAKMAQGVSYCKALTGPVFNAYTDRFERSMSGFNRFIKDNMAAFTTPVTYAAIKMTNGKLWRPLTFTAQKVGTILALTWDSVSLGNNGSLTDKIYAAAIYYPSGIWYFPAAEHERIAGSTEVTVPASSSATQFECYLWAAKYSATSPTLLEMLSNSIYAESTAP